ncbi:Hypothetical protein D9617_9g023190 [Elsinoe fawcettii]|nr:Hypothetical protein D9617_9g023190 [Elsinoe fawcettii]
MFTTISLLFVLFAASSSGMPIDDLHYRQLIQWVSCGSLVEEIAGPNNTIDLVFDCATLPVPLDYTDEASPLLNISLVRLNATQEPVIGNTLINPGGPGGPGIEQIVLAGNQYLELTGQYNWIGFDPRQNGGTGRTIPFDCKATPPRDYFPLAQESLVNDTLLENAWDSTTRYANRCLDAQASNGPFLSTSFVARDMLEILKRLPDEKLNYVGTSYGTFLGEVFASMFPQHVGRFVLDAVVNPSDWRSGTRSTFLSDTDLVYDGFFSECAATPSNCALTTLVPSPADPAAIRAIVDSWILSTLKVDDFLYRGIKNVIRQALYSPSIWPTLAQSLTYYITLPPNATLPDPETAVPASPYNLGIDAFWGISCLDTPWRLDGPADLAPFAAEQQPLSYFANTFADVTIWRCAAWSIEAAEYYTGPFEACTATPILFVGGKRDPVTPMAEAFNASSGFHGSRVVTNDGFGHSFFQDPSKCTYNAVREYLVEGTLPEEGLVCQADKRPFDPTRGASNVTAQTA